MYKRTIEIRSKYFEVFDIITKIFIFTNNFLYSTMGKNY